jgi:hypothetical protein
VNLSKPPAGDTDWAGEINLNWAALENALTFGVGLTTSASSPSQLTANQNNYAFPSPGNADYIFQRLSSDTSRSITGLAGGSDGKKYLIANIGANNIVFADDSPSSLAANRILTGTGDDLTLLPNQLVMAIYDNGTQRWRLGAKSGGSVGVDLGIVLMLTD